MDSIYGYLVEVPLSEPRQEIINLFDRPFDLLTGSDNPTKKPLCPVMVCGAVMKSILSNNNFNGQLSMLLGDRSESAYVYPVRALTKNSCPIAFRLGL